MSNKRLFQVFDEMNVNDGVNNTATCACCFDMVDARTAKGGGNVTMGVPAEAIVKIMNNEYKPIMILLDYNEYKRLEAIPADDKLQAAEEKAERYEKALEAILNTNHDNHEKVILKVKAIATEALTPKTTTDEITS